jgi:hypothetical protein
MIKLSENQQGDTCILERSLLRYSMGQHGQVEMMPVSMVLHWSMMLEKHIARMFYKDLTEALWQGHDEAGHDTSKHWNPDRYIMIDLTKAVAFYMEYKE